METERTKVELPYVVTEVAIDQLKPAFWNPPRRVTQVAIAQLADSIASVGLREPIEVTPDLMVVDGHRRLAACRMLGYTTIPAFVRNGLDPVLVYRELNVSQTKHSDVDACYVYLKAREAVSKSKQKQLMAMEHFLGREFMETYTTPDGKGLSSQKYQIARRFAKVAERHGDVELVKRAILWEIRHNMAYALRKLYESVIGVANLPVAFDCIDNDKPLPPDVY